MRQWQQKCAVALWVEQSGIASCVDYILGINVCFAFVSVTEVHIKWCIIHQLLLSSKWANERENSYSSAIQLKQEVISDVCLCVCVCVCESGVFAAKDFINICSVIINVYIITCTTQPKLKFIASQLPPKKGFEKMHMSRILIISIDSDANQPHRVYYHGSPTLE